MLLTILNRSRRQHPTKHQLCGHLPSITKTIQIRRTRHAGHCWRSRDELISDVLIGTPHMAEQKQGDQLEPTYSSSVRIRGVALRTCQKLWTIGRSGERGSGISVLMARQDDDDEILSNKCNVLFYHDFLYIMFVFGLRNWILRGQLIQFAVGSCTIYILGLTRFLLYFSEVSSC